MAARPICSYAPLQACPFLPCISRSKCSRASSCSNIPVADSPVRISPEVVRSIGVFGSDRVSSCSWWIVPCLPGNVQIGHSRSSPSDGNSEILTTYVLQARPRTPKRAMRVFAAAHPGQLCRFPLPNWLSVCAHPKAKGKVMFLHLAGGTWLIHEKVREPIVAPPIRTCSALEQFVPGGARKNFAHIRREAPC